MRNNVVVHRRRLQGENQRNCHADTNDKFSAGRSSNYVASSCNGDTNRKCDTNCFAHDIGSTHCNTNDNADNDTVCISNSDSYDHAAAGYANNCTIADNHRTAN
ncbi:MAG TPA: hypothetical protein VJ553_01115 [Candidatus Paceibacterota bacterium]|nr:hypothetical protein [Candidatus Paceibacterota bacterium]